MKETSSKTSSRTLWARLTTFTVGLSIKYESYDMPFKHDKFSRHLFDKTFIIKEETALHNICLSHSWSMPKMVAHLRDQKYNELDQDRDRDLVMQLAQDR